MVFITYIIVSSFSDHLPIRLLDLGGKNQAIYLWISRARGRRFILKERKTKSERSSRYL